MPPPIVAIVAAAFALALGGLAASSSPLHMALAIGLLVIFTATFIRAEWGLYILIFSMLLSPEITIGETAAGTLGRGVTLRLEDLLLVVIGLSWFARNAVVKELGLFLKTPLNLPIFLYMVACVLSTGFGYMAGRVELKTGALYVLKYFQYFIVYFMVVNHVGSRAQLKRYVFCLFLTAFIVAIFSYLQIPSGERTSAPFEGHGGEPNTFGGYLLFVGMVAAGIAVKTRDVRERHLLLLFIVCLVPPFFFTQSRSSYLAFIPAGLALALMAERRFVVVGLVCIGLMASPLFLPEVVKQRISYTFNQPEEPGQITIGSLRLDTSTSARLESWKWVARDFTRHPFLGHGVTGYAFVDSQLPRVLAETGLLGMAAFLCLLAAVFKLAWRRFKTAQEPYYRGLAMGFLAGFVGLVVHSLGTNTFILVRIMEPFWFFVGIIVVLPGLQADVPAAAAAPAPRGRPPLSAARRPPARPRLS
ncbi:MAG: O-antigen ligase family protein [Desulfobacterales bacterium]|jgi:O-antigen ligase|nr:O-antigen ligase family protein [Desulfobacterales bacterium]